MDVNRKDFAEVNGQYAAPEETFVDCDILIIKGEDPQDLSTGDSARTEQLVTKQDIEKGTLVARVSHHGHTIPTRFWNTIEVGPVNGGTGAGVDKVDGTRHANIGFKFVKANHSFSPNMRIFMDYENETIEWYSLSFIPSGSALSWNYCTSEWEMDERFQDWESGKQTQGFKHLSEADKMDLLKNGHCCPHVYAKWSSNQHAEQTDVSDTVSTTSSSN